MVPELSRDGVARALGDDDRPPVAARDAQLVVEEEDVERAVRGFLHLVRHRTVGRHPGRRETRER